MFGLLVFLVIIALAVVIVKALLDGSNMTTQSKTIVWLILLLFALAWFFGGHPYGWPR